MSVVGFVGDTDDIIAAVTKHGMLVESFFSTFLTIVNPLPH